MQYCEAADMAGELIQKMIGMDSTDESLCELEALAALLAILEEKDSG